MTHRVDGGGGLSCVVDTERGARIVNLTSAAAGAGRHEWLAPSTDTWPPRETEGGVVPFVREGMGGWDEACPTVAATTLGTGARLSDHGEAWRVPWMVEEETPHLLTTSVRLQSLPVRLSRTISATADGLRLVYIATTTALRPVPLLWSAHPQFAADLGDTVQLRGSNEDHLIEEYPRPGVRHGLGLAATPVLQGLSPGRSLKVFVETAVMGAVGGATLHRASGGELQMRWGSAAPLHLGVFWDRQEFAGSSIIAIEPSTGFGDAAGAAEKAGRIALLEQDRPLQWWIEVAARRA
ncbi:hypothetical protein [Subtercola boreus]|uniref:Aldose epimerase n=1 Tax=Subtercola boreus TaxID=120213 RepID=A0A3E0W9Z6_9MICO|nr:hypothetical protein [Subtercola boreus]RFA20592.1 hypothetical protein B7R24_09175 [Subtercola boreus]RFA20707.1 hypothetical protein B7R23_09110 [Subtercola boreus]RFA26917.1 hypothetical protein B7R25_09240 [Subtercola boreus]